MVENSLKLSIYLGLIIFIWYHCSKKEREEKFKFTTNFFNIMFGFMFIPALPFLVMGIFLGNKTTSIIEKFLALSGVTFPVMIIISILLSVKFYNKKEYKNAMLCSLIPYLNIIFLVTIFK